jgi:hypothetical protein
VSLRSGECTVGIWKGSGGNVEGRGDEKG